MRIIVDTFEGRIQNGVFNTIDSIVAPKIELAIRSNKASAGRDATCVTASSYCGEHVGITATFENASENNNVLHVSNLKNEIRTKILDEVSELSSPETRFNRHTHSSQKSQLLM